MENSLSISLVILTCNRKESVIAALKHLLRQKRQPDEIIVVDNHSSDGTDSYIGEHFKSVKLLRMDRNLGCAGRNHGIKAARGDVVVTLDDDIFFEHADSLARLENLFQKDRRLIALNFKVLDFETKEMLAFNWFHPYKMEEYCDRSFITDYISEGAVAFRRAIFEEVGYYPEVFFISHEGPDLAYRILDSGYDLNYSSEISVLHRCATNQRASWRNTYYDTRNQIWLAVRNLPFADAVLHIAYRVLTTFMFAVRRRQLGWYVKAIWDGFTGIRSQLAFRHPVQKATLRRIKKIQAHKPGFLYKVPSFWRRTKAINQKFSIS